MTVLEMPQPTDGIIEMVWKNVQKIGLILSAHETWKGRI
jgi:hypothetical protein